MTSEPDPRIRLLRMPQPRHWVLLGLGGTVAILLVGFAVKLIPAALPAELALDEEITDHQHPALNVIGVAVSEILSPVGAIVLLTCTFLFLLVARRSPVNAFASTGLAAFGWLGSEAFKILVAEPRPTAALLDTPLLAESGLDSFPSGHTTFVASYAIACWLLARGTRWERPVLALGIAATLGMGAVRLYVSAHYLTDVVGSVLVSATAAIVFIGVWNRLGPAAVGRLRNRAT